MTLIRHTQYGESGPAIVVLHGLLGMARNWSAIAKRLSDAYTVYALDLPNHGESGHCEQFTYESIAAEVLAWMDAQHLDRIILLGHSLGGRTAMRLATTHPERVSRLIVVDISASASPPRWKREIAAMLAMDTAALKNRQEAEEILEASGIEGWAFRKFLITNLERDPDGGFRWKANLPALERALPHIFDKPVDERALFDGPTLLVRGGDSSFVPEGALPELLRHFPNLQVETIPAAGHNVHADQPEAFLTILRHFLSASD